MCVLCVHVQLEQAVLKLYLSRYGESNYSAIMRVREIWIARYRNGTLSSAELRKLVMLWFALNMLSCVCVIVNANRTDLSVYSRHGRPARRDSPTLLRQTDWLLIVVACWAPVLKLRGPRR
jgi:hypothetical protein